MKIFLLTFTFLGSTCLNSLTIKAEKPEAENNKIGYYKCSLKCVAGEPVIDQQVTIKEIINYSKKIEQAVTIIEIGDSIHQVYQKLLNQCNKLRGHLVINSKNSSIHIPSAVIQTANYQEGLLINSNCQYK